jgi:hypothetical protein
MSQLYHIPMDERTYEICLEFVMKNFVNLQHVPFKHRTYGMFKTMVSGGFNIEFVPNEFKNTELYDIYYNLRNKNTEVAISVKDINESEQTQVQQTIKSYWVPTKKYISSIIDEYMFD